MQQPSPHTLGLQPPGPSALAPSGKMVSLDLLLGSPPATPRDGPLLQPVDSSDPLVQQLVQDKSFLTAVQTSQLHAAAAVAVRLLRSHLAGGSEFKRPPPRVVPRDTSYPYGEPSLGAPEAAGAARGAGGPVRGGLVVQRQLVEPRHREAMRCMRLEVLGLEDTIPWNSVRRAWKAKRTTWRRQVKQTEVLPEFAARLKELRAALLTDDQPLPGCGSTWRAQLELCISGKGSYGLLAAAWEEMRGTVRGWLEGRAKPAALSAAALQAGATRAVRAMQAALAAGGGGGEANADAALVQVPLESIIGHDSGVGLAAVRTALETEQKLLGARRMGRSPSQQQLSEGSGDGGGGGNGAAQQQPPIVSYFSSISAAWSDGFDSGVASPDDVSGEATDLDEDFDP
ncbi:septin-10-isoform A [Micractinium conductrix]|uniref:Septin-10-isoform A n=1 Tax=Micractinium conductrix TaxID=554055 RepID=A0A2P6VFH0_9CHLO|nr:septin-10-isoform A [Micractinium conductrix]|eukprot:PSC72843.1 septin-10-isoform A [Micractinium conductrix]